MRKVITLGGWWVFTIVGFVFVALLVFGEIWKILKDIF